MVSITKATSIEDEAQRANSLKKIEAAASTQQLEKLAKLSENPEMIAMLDSFNL